MLNGRTRPEVEWSQGEWALSELWDHDAAVARPLWTDADEVSVQSALMFDGRQIRVRP